MAHFPAGANLYENGPPVVRVGAVPMYLNVPEAGSNDGAGQVSRQSYEDASVLQHLRSLEAASHGKPNGATAAGRLVCLNPLLSLSC